MRIVIIGAGCAGLAAGVKLANIFKDILILEKNSIPGGRARRINLHNMMGTDLADLGQHLMLGCYQNLLHLAEIVGNRAKLEIRHCVTPFISEDGQVYPFRTSPLPFPIGNLFTLCSLGHLGIRDRLFLILPCLASLASNSLKEFLDQIDSVTLLKELGQSEHSIRMFWSPIIKSTNNCPANEASAFLVGRVIREMFIGSTDRVAPIYNHAQTLHDAIFEPCVSFIKRKSGSVRFRTSVKRIVVEQGNVKGVIVESGEMIDADVVVLACALWEVESLLEGIADMQFISEICNSLPSSPILTIEMWFDKDFVGYPFVGLLNSRFDFIFRHESKVSKVRLSLVLSNAKAMMNIQRQGLLDIVTEELAKLFPKSKDANLLDMKIVLVKKATFMGKIGQASMRPSNKTPIKGLYIAGDYTDTNLPATLEGATISGFRAGELIIREFG